MSITSVSPVVTDSGISTPTYDEILEYLQSQFRQIFGPDVYLGPDSQDGEWLAILADAFNDCNAVAVAAYNSFSPATAQGEALSSVVKINGISRTVASESTVDLDIIGQPGTVIEQGSVRDINGSVWNLPDTVTVGLDGEVVVTATAEEAGGKRAAPGTVTEIATPTRGWQSVTNSSEAVPGQPVETDAELRRRQQDSTELASQTVMTGLSAGISNIVGVSRYRGYENDSDSEDANGLAPHSISYVVEGGEAFEIADVIARRKTPGVPTEGDVSVDVNLGGSTTTTIRFYRPKAVMIDVDITLKALSGFLSTTGDDIKEAISEYINSRGIGNDIFYGRLNVPANLLNTDRTETFDIEEMVISVDGGPYSMDNADIAFNAVAQCDVSNVSITVVTDG